MQQDIARKDQDPKQEAGISRRSFVGLAVGAVTVLPAVAGGFALPFAAEEAYAAEEGQSTAKIIVAKSYEVGLVVADMANGKKAPVAGATVLVKSLYNNKEISGKTNSSGCYLADIRELAKKETVDGVERYSLYAQVDVAVGGYRRFRSRRVELKGARGVLLPTRKLADEKLYPSGVAFDDWDVLYTKNEFAVTTANDIRHNLTVDLVCARNFPVEVRLVHTDSGKVLAKAEGVTPHYTSASCVLGDFFLLSGHASALPTTGGFHLELVQDGAQYNVPLGLGACSAPAGVTAPSSTKAYLSPFNVGAMKPQLEIPKSVPIIGGDTIQVWTPDLDVEVMFNPFGYFKIAYRSEERGYKSANGDPDPNAWKSHPRKTFAEQWQKASDARDKMMKSVGDARRREGTFKKAGFTSNLSATAMIAGMLAGRWSADSGLWRGQLGVQGTLAFNFAYAQQFMAGPVPLVIEFSLNSSLSLGVVVAVSTPEVFSPSKYAMDYGSTGVSLTIVITPSLSLGVGVKGVLTASIQGLVSFSILVHAGPLPANATKEMTNPHVVLGLKAQVNVVVQALIFTVTHTLFEVNKPAFRDNWQPALSTQSDLLPQAGEGESWDTIFGNVDDMSIVTEGSIGEASEFELAWGEEESADGAIPEDWLDYDETSDEEGWITWGDGLTGQTGSGYWLDTDGGGDPDGSTSGFVYSSDGDVSDWSVWDDVEDGALRGVPLSGQVADDDSTPKSTRIRRRTVEYVTDDGIPYPVTVFEPVAVPAVETQAAIAVGPGGEGMLMAGASGALAAPSAGEATKDGALSTQASAQTVRRCKVTRKPDKIAGGATKVARPDSAPAARLARDTGVVPLCDAKVLESVFSDPRVKVVKLFNCSYLFRIAAVDIKSASGATCNRTRIVAQKIVATGQNAEPMRVLDFAHDTFEGGPAVADLYRRDDLFDYDFDIRVRVEGSYIAELDLFIISGKRANGNDTTIGQAASDQVFTHAVCQFTQTNSQMKITYAFSARTSDAAFAATGDSALKYHNFSCPQIVETAKGEYVATYLDRAAATPEGVLSNDASVGFGVCFTTRYGHMKPANVSALVAAADPITDASIYEMVMLDRVKFATAGDKSERSWIPVMLRGQNGTYHYLLETLATSVYKRADRPAAKVCSLKKLNVADDQGNVPQRLVTWPGREALLASVGGKLAKGTLTGLESAEPAVSYEEIGPANFSISAFGADPTGHFIYWPASLEGSPGFSYDGVADNPDQAESLPEVERHRIMACKLRKGKFSDPFVFAEVGHDMDTLEVVASRDTEAMSFVSCDLRKVKEGKADIWYTSLPNTKCANVIGIEALSEVVYPGENAVFHLTVRNDGNTYLSGLTAQVCEKGSKTVLTETKLAFSKETLVESGYNPAGADGALQNVEDDYTLAPGKTSVYQIRVKIPETWTGEKSVSVTAKDAIVSPSPSSVASVRGLSVQADEDQDGGEGNYDYDDSDAFEYVAGSDEGDYGDEGAPFDVIEVQSEDDLDEYVEGYDDELADAPVQEAGADGAAPTSASTKPTPARPVSSAPKTGDALAGLGGLFAVAAAASAAMTAYSARRIANERAAAENGDDARDGDLS